MDWTQKGAFQVQGGTESVNLLRHEQAQWTPACVSRSVVSNSVTPWTAARQAPLSMGFSRQEPWSGLPCPPSSRGSSPPRIEPESPALQTNSFPAEPSGKPGGHLKQPCLGEGKEACLHCMQTWEWVGFTVGAKTEAWALFCRYLGAGEMALERDVTESKLCFKKVNMPSVIKI